MQLDEPREDLSIPIGKDGVRVYGRPTFAPADVLEIEGGIEAPIGKRGATLGAEGFYRRFHGAPKGDAGAGLRLRVPFQQGGVVKMQAGGWIPSWVPFIGNSDPKVMTPEEIEKRSWDRDPGVKSIPTADEGIATNRYAREHGDPNWRMTDIGDTYGEDRVNDWSRRFGGQSADPAKALPESGQAKRKITPAEADHLKVGQVMANTMPGSFGRYDPGRTTLSDPRYKSAVGGATYKKNYWLDTTADNSVAHELNHPAFYELMKTKDGKKLLLEMDRKWVTGKDIDKDLDLNELIVRANMQRHYGPNAEEGSHPHHVGRAAELLKNPGFVADMRKLDKMMHHGAAQRTIDRAGGVYKKGGPVLQTRGQR